MKPVEPYCLGCASDAQPVASGIATMNAFTSILCVIAMRGTKATGPYVAALCDAHRRAFILSMIAFSRLNEIPGAELRSRIGELFGLGPTWSDA